MAEKKTAPAKAPKLVRLEDPTSGSVVEVSEEYADRLTKRGYLSLDESKSPDSREWSDEKK